MVQTNRTEGIDGIDGTEGGLDDFVVTAETPYAVAHRWINRIQHDIARFDPQPDARIITIQTFSNLRPDRLAELLPSIQEFSTATPAMRAEMVLAITERILHMEDILHTKGTSLGQGSVRRYGPTLYGNSVDLYYVTNQVLHTLLTFLISNSQSNSQSDSQSKSLCLSDHQICSLLDLCVRLTDFDIAQNSRRHLRNKFVAPLLYFLQGYPLVQQLSTEVLSKLEYLHDSPVHPQSAFRGAISRIFGYDDWKVMRPGAVWVNMLLRELRGMMRDQREAWLDLLRHAYATEGGSPKKTWLKEATRLRDRIDRDDFRERLMRWLDAAYQPLTRQFFDLKDLYYLHGLIWLAALIEAEGERFTRLCDTLEKLAARLDGHMFTLCRHACYATLAGMPGRAGLFALVRLRAKTQDGNSIPLLKRTLQRVAIKEGLTLYDLDDLTVPTFGLDERGILRQTFGDCAVEISFTEEKPVWNWIGANGKPRKTIPPKVKSHHAAQLADVKALVNEILKTQEFQCERIERIYRTIHSWRLADWRERYPKHPLLQSFAHRLLWQLTVAGMDGKTSVQPALWREGRFEDVAGNALGMEKLERMSSVRVELWHPVASEVETVLAWRARLDALGIIQPFKQAHREAYLLTDAERATDIYSNRFAAHIIRQFVFHRHCKRLGWFNRLRIVNGMSDKRAAYYLDDWGLQAELWVETVDDPRILEGNVGTYTYLSTDQVRFRKQRQRLKPGQPLPTDPHHDAVSLADVHPRLFWEIMRDVDAMVARASIANDPTWQDRGITLSLGSSGEGHNRYAYTGVELGLPERRGMLEKLLPRLNIASRCTLTDTSLIVRGDVRTYKIHLGSGSILMEPNDQYLCIIRSRAGAGEPYVHPAALSFEGDSILSLILSKAVLLASDSTVTDPVILQQIRPNVHPRR